MKRAFILCLSISVAVQIAAASNLISWVASNGVDSSTCGSRTQPCATFQKAHDNTTAGGMVKAVDAADYRPFTISKSITIDGTGTGAAITADNGATAINIFAGASDQITIRGLSIHTTGYGIEQNIGNVHIENVIVTGSGSFEGVIAVSTLTASHLSVIGGGQGVLANVGSSVTIRDSVLRGNQAGILVRGSNGNGATAMIERCEISFNTTGIQSDASSGPALVRISDSVITGNTTGLSQVRGGTIISFRTNMLAGNGVDGTPSLSTSLK